MTCLINGMIPTHLGKDTIIFSKVSGLRFIGFQHLGRNQRWVEIRNRTACAGKVGLKSEKSICRNLRVLE